MRVAVVVRKEADTVAGHFVVLRTLLDAVVYLGCVTDAGSPPRLAWVCGDLPKVQSLNGLAGSPYAASA